MSSSAQRSRPSSPRLAQLGVFVAQVSECRRDRSHWRDADKIEHARCGLRGNRWYRGERPQVYAANYSPWQMRTPATSTEFTSASQIRDTTVHKMGA